MVRRRRRTTRIVRIDGMLADISDRIGEGGKIFTTLKMRGAADQIEEKKGAGALREKKKSRASEKKSTITVHGGEKRTRTPRENWPKGAATSLEKTGSVRSVA